MGDQIIGICQKNALEIPEEEFLTELQRGNFVALDAFYKSELTYERCMAVAQGFSLRRIPKRMHTVKMCLISIKKDESNIQDVAKRLLGSEFYLEAAKANGLILNWIDKNLITPEIVLAAVSSNGLSLQYVPEEMLSEDVFWTAVKSNGCALEYIPLNYRTKELCTAAVTSCALALKHVPSKWKIKSLCLQAVESDGAALEYVPQKYIDHDLCEKALADNPLALRGVPEKLKSIDMAINALSRDARATDGIPLEWFKTPELRKIAYNQNVMKLISKRFDKENNKLVVSEKVGYKWEQLRKRSQKFIPAEYQQLDNMFETFEAFCTYLDGDLTGAELDGYDFSKVDLSGCLVDGSDIPTDILVKQGMDGYDLYERLIQPDMTESVAVANELVPAASVFHLETFQGENEPFTEKCYYISDLHLDHKICQHFRNRATNLDIRRYIVSKISEMVAGCDNYYDLLILGDVSFNFEVSRIFYEELAKQWDSKHIIAVLGNHELWGYCLPVQSAEEITKEYACFLGKLGITLLQNSLIVDGKYVSEEQLRTVSVSELRKECLKSKKIIFGGTGFSAYCKEFNADNGIYRNTMDQTEELQRTEKFESLYKKVRDSFGEKPIVVATHMPKTSWSKEDYCKNWIYVSGHTHRNECIEGEEYTLYADNQIGYHQQLFALKWFNMSLTYDVFAYYKNGMYEISKADYLDFCRGIRLSMNFKRNGGRVIMLKKNGYYMFLFKDDDRANTLYLLNGGTLKKLSRDDPLYYYEKMDFYAENVKYMLIDYNKALAQLSEAVRSVGGEGKIHGCIVDIDRYAHVYLNPIDGTITPYYATDIVNKFVYKNVNTLIEKCCPKVMRRLKKADEHSLALFKKKVIKEAAAEIPTYVSDTSMYTPSRIMKSLQYTTDANVIRSWYEQLEVPRNVKLTGK